MAEMKGFEPPELKCSSATPTIVTTQRTGSSLSRALHNRETKAELPGEMRAVSCDCCLRLDCCWLLTPRCERPCRIRRSVSPTVGRDIGQSKLGATGDRADRTFANRHISRPDADAFTHDARGH